MLLLMQQPSSLLTTCPYHRILASRALSVIHATPSPSLISSFLLLSRNDTPSIHRSILISALSNSSSSFLVSVQASAPYIIRFITGWIRIHLNHFLFCSINNFPKLILLTTSNLPLIFNLMFSYVDFFDLNLLNLSTICS